MVTHTSHHYQAAGVNRQSAASFIRLIKPLVEKTHRPGVLTSIGHYAGLFALDKDLKNPVLCASTDGVGTKLKTALETGLIERLGQDLVAMNANDILCLGARPLFFLDYLATGRLRPRQAALLFKGISEACRRIRCAILGGETAEMPSLYRADDFDLAGFIVGIVERGKIIDGRRIRPGHDLIGLPSSGPHSNGYSLIRKIVKDNRLRLSKRYPPLTIPLKQALMTPTRLYGPIVEPLIRRFKVDGIAHITGGGFDNIPRVLPKNCRVVVDSKAWKVPAIFHLLQKWGGIPTAEMWRVFNMGIGLVLIAPHGEAIVRSLRQRGETAWWIGRIERRTAGQPPLKIV